MMFEKIVEDMPLQQTVPAPAASPEVADMDITRPVAGSFSAEVAADEPAWRGFAEGAIGEITAALPSLGALAEADELEDAVGKPLYAISAFGSDITASVPGLGDLLAEDEAAEPASNVPAAMPETSAEMDMATGNLLAMGGAGEATPASMQRVQLPAEDPATVSPAAHSDVHPTGLANKWGFVPGDDDTMDLDLKGHGKH